MKRSCFPEEGVWLKGNIHSHSTVSDGDLSPEELAEGYKAHGYSFLALTDHNVAAGHQDLEREGFLLLTGVEHDIAYNQDKCMHAVGLLAPEKEETGYPCRKYSQTEIDAPTFASMMHNDGQFVSLAHPVWSRMEWDEILAMDGIDAVEVFNNGTEHLCHAGSGETWWDMLLRHGKRVFATAVDDVHHAGDLYGGWIRLKAERPDRKSIFNALKRGEYYCSCGPEIYDFGLEDGEVYISCSPSRSVHFVSYAPRGRSFFAGDGEELLSGAQYKLKGRESWVRAVIVDREGRQAWTNPIWF